MLYNEDMLETRSSWQKFSRLPLAVIVISLSLLLSGSAWVSAGNDNRQDPYSDTPLTGTHAENIVRLKDLGIFDGTECGPDQFCPGEPLSRRTFAVWMVRILDGDQAPGFVDPAVGGKSRFADVGPDEPEALFIDRLAELKVTAGCASDPPRYCPDQNVSRSQMASFLARALDLPEAEPANFADVSEKSVHYGNINRLAASKITVGCAGDPPRYCPDQPTTRGQMASFLARALDWQSAKNSITVTRYDNSVDLRVAYDDEKYEATVTWRAPSSGHGQVEHYVLQSRLILGEFRPEFSQIVDAGSGKAGYRVRVSNITNTNQLYTFRVIAVYADGQRLATSEVKTPSKVHKLRDIIWEKVVKPKQNEQPWLTELWQHINATKESDLGSQFRLSFGPNAAYRGGEYPKPGGLKRSFIKSIAVLEATLTNPDVRYYIKGLVEELGHVYTYTDGIENSVPIAVGHLYLHTLKVNHGAGAKDPVACGALELYGDLAVMAFFDRYSDFDSSQGLGVNYRDGVGMAEWYLCGFQLSPPEAARVDREVPEITRSIFVDREIPQWFYDTYQKPDGAIDLERLWSDITIDKRFESTMGSIAYNLRNEFGGYCSEEQVRKFIEGKATGITNPWKDGGCNDNVETVGGNDEQQVGTRPIDNPFYGSYTLRSLQIRNRLDRCWIAIDGYVYNVTPGSGGYSYPGPGSIADLCGRDVSDHFASNNIELPPSRYIVGSIRD